MSCLVSFHRLSFCLHFCKWRPKVIKWNHSCINRDLYSKLSFIEALRSLRKDREAKQCKRWIGKKSRGVSYSTIMTGEWPRAHAVKHDAGESYSSVTLSNGSKGINGRFSRLNTSKKNNSLRGFLLEHLDRRRCCSGHVVTHTSFSPSVRSGWFRCRAHYTCYTHTSIDRRAPSGFTWI